MSKEDVVSTSCDCLLIIHIDQCRGSFFQADTLFNLTNSIHVYMYVDGITKSHRLSVLEICIECNSSVKTCEFESHPGPKLGGFNRDLNNIKISLFISPSESLCTLYPQDLLDQNLAQATILLTRFYTRWLRCLPKD